MDRPFALPRRPDPPKKSRAIAEHFFRARNDPNDLTPRQGEDKCRTFCIQQKSLRPEAVTDQSAAMMACLILTWPSSERWEAKAMRPTQSNSSPAVHAACFENALLRVSREARHHFADDDVEVVTGNPSGE
jgi:hypothetical protein